MNFRAAEFRERILPIALSQSVGMACGIVGVKIVSKLVPPASLGAYGVFLTFTTLGASLVHSGVVKFVGRHWAKNFRQSSFVAHVFRAWLRKLPWLLIGTVAAAVALQRADQGTFWVAFPALLLAALGLSLGAIAQMALQSIRRNWADFAVSSAGSLTRTFAPPFLYVLSGGVLSGLYFGFCVHAVCVATLGLLMLRPQMASSDKQSDHRSSTVYEGPLFFILSLAGWVLIGLNRWVAVIAFGETVGGYYTLAGNIAQIIAAVLGAMMIQYLQPMFYALGDLQTKEAFHRLARGVDLATFAVAAMGVAALTVLRTIAPYLVGPLIDHKYASALTWIVPSGCFGLTVVLGQFYHVMLLAGRRERSCAPVDLTTAAVLIGGSVLTAWAGPVVYKDWLMFTPIVVLLLTRPMARSYLFRTPFAPIPAELNPSLH